MLSVRCIVLGLFALLLGSVLAAPLPHIPQIGEIVHVAPSQTNGGTVIGAGGHVPHPHITVGYDPHTGLALLHPVTHASVAGLGPRISANGMHDRLHGNVLLNQVTAHHSILQGPRGGHAAAIVNQHNLNAIHHARQQTQALVNAHNDAARRHRDAQHAHTNAANAHLAAAQQHTHAGHHDWAAAHRAQAAWHQGQASVHGQHHASHTAAAGNVLGPDAHALHQAQQSSASAHTSHNTAAASHRYATDSLVHHIASQNHLNAAHAHQTLAQSYQRMGPHYNQHAQNHFAIAQQHRQTSASHGVSSWVNSPHPHQSATHAIHSSNTARHTKSQLPPHAQVH